MDVRMFVNSNVRNAYIWLLAEILTKTGEFNDFRYTNNN
jgi:hypothetical protein